MLIDSRYVVRKQMETEEGESALQESWEALRWTDSCLNCQRSSQKVSSSPGGQVVGHSEFNLCSVGSCDVVRLNPRPHISTRFHGKTG